mmetsp:Transcript_32701/g.105687  ORF Transcript_32701/g.105687 Transcript_32701/m.105687 type:complete len:597 (+) Transcript_32701:289-2079(+)
MADVRAVPKQQLNQPLEATAGTVGGGGYQRGPAMAVLMVDIRATLQQQVNHPPLAVPGSVHQQRDVFSLVYFERPIDPPAAVEPRQHCHPIARSRRLHSLGGHDGIDLRLHHRLEPRPQPVGLPGRRCGSRHCRCPAADPWLRRLDCADSRAGRLGAATGRAEPHRRRLRPHRDLGPPLVAAHRLHLGGMRLQGAERRHRSKSRLAQRDPDALLEAAKPLAQAEARRLDGRLAAELAQELDELCGEPLGRRPRRAAVRRRLHDLAILLVELHHVQALVPPLWRTALHDARAPASVAEADGEPLAAPAGDERGEHSHGRRGLERRDLGALVRAVRRAQDLLVCEGVDPPKAEAAGAGPYRASPKQALLLQHHLEPGGHALPSERLEGSGLAVVRLQVRRAEDRGVDRLLEGGLRLASFEQGCGGVRKAGSAREVGLGALGRHAPCSGLGLTVRVEGHADARAVGEKSEDDIAEVALCAGKARRGSVLRGAAERLEERHRCDVRIREARRPLVPHHRHPRLPSLERCVAQVLERLPARVHEHRELVCERVLAILVVPGHRVVERRRSRSPGVRPHVLLLRRSGNGDRRPELRVRRVLR